MGVGLGTLVSAGSVVVLLLASFVGFLWRRQGKEKQQERRVKETNVAALAWHYKIRALAAARGWDQDPLWPPTPFEMTAEYIAGITKEESDAAAQRLAELAEAIGKVKP